MTHIDSVKQELLNMKIPDEEYQRYRSEGFMQYMNNSPQDIKVVLNFVKDGHLYHISIQQKRNKFMDEY